MLEVESWKLREELLGNAWDDKKAMETAGRIIFGMSVQHRPHAIMASNVTGKAEM